MANRRMLSLSIVDTDAFSDMPMSSQVLYFHLLMRADDEGFIGNHKKIMRMIGSQEDDLKVLTTKRFILSFESGVVVIKHWLIHNTIRMDRFKETTYKKEKKLLKFNEFNAYTESWQPNGNQMETQVKLSKVKLSKVKLRESENSPKKIAYNFFNNETDREDKIKTLIEKYNLDRGFITAEINKFLNYWSELNGSGKKQRWELEKTFEIDRRLSSWFLRANKFNTNNKSKFTTI